jgi:hypothetical protein
MVHLEYIQVSIREVEQPSLSQQAIIASGHASPVRILKFSHQTSRPHSHHSVHSILTAARTDVPFPQPPILQSPSRNGLPLISRCLDTRFLIDIERYDVNVSEFLEIFDSHREMIWLILHNSIIFLHQWFMTNSSFQSKPE